MHRFCKSFACLVVLLVSLAGESLAAHAPQAPGPVPAEPDTVVFTNGDRLTGKLINAAGGNVTFHSDMAGDLTIPFSKVKELRSGSTFVALEAGKPGQYRPAATGSVRFAEGDVTLTPPTTANQGAAATVLPEKKLGFLIDVASYSREVGHQQSFFSGWTGAATAGLTLVRSTQSSTTFTGALNLVRQIPSVAYLPKLHRTTVNVTETYGTNTSPVIPQTTPASAPVVVQTSIFHADAERDRYLNTRLYALADTSFDHNFASGLQLQQIYGAGVGWTPLQDARQQLDLKADAHFEKQQFLQSVAAPVNPTLVGSTFQENYRRDLPRKLVITEWANIVPAWNDLVAYSANAYVGLALPMYKRLNVSLSATDNYINDPAQFYRTNTVQYVTGVTYVFK